MIDIDRYYDYESVEIIDGEDVDHNGDKLTTHTHIYKFSSPHDDYYLEITWIEEYGDYFTADYQDSDSYLKNEDGLFDRTYKDTGNHDAIKIISTVFKIIKDFYENNDNLHVFGFNVKDIKRLKIYKYVIEKIFPSWKYSEEDSYDESETRHIYYKF